MKEFELKYGCNPNQKPAKVYMEDGRELPFEILNGRPGYINFLDALNSWQLVRELDEALGEPAATSFKHVSPTSASIAVPMSDALKKSCFVDDVEDLDDSKLATAYARARGTDRMSSFGDFIALSRPCDVVTAKLIKREVSDGIIAPGFDEDALKILRSKKKGNYNIIEIDPDYVPVHEETKQVFGVTFSQGRNDCKINRDVLGKIVTKNKNLTNEGRRDLIVALITLKYTQSNSVAFAKEGQAIGVGAGQQSRIHCTRLAGDKADIWHLRQSEKVLGLPFKNDIPRAVRDNTIDVYLGRDYMDVIRDGQWEDVFTVKPEPFTKEEQTEYLSKINGVALGSDAFFPFGDNIERAVKSGVSFVAQPGGSIRDENVIETCDKFAMVMAFTGMRLFHH
ncbi:MAG: phosphoribosylaminoimidazolecarboxamide formyltransferase [Clostridiales bacterium]|nr:phosphoribosylaminoimidazolecarboxamide formyltransferase [Clostridiales bacterium]